MSHCLAKLRPLLNTERVADIAIEIIFETHSTSVDNERGIATGWLDGALSDQGKLQAKKLGERRLAEGVDAVFTSDLGRAVETANIAFEGSQVPIKVDARLRECNYGALNGVPTVRLEAERLMRVTVPFPEGESYSDVVTRIKDFLTDLQLQSDYKRVVVIGHSATRWALDHLLSSKALEDLVSAPFEWQEGWPYVVG